MGKPRVLCVGGWTGSAKEGQCNSKDYEVLSSAKNSYSTIARLINDIDVSFNRIYLFTKSSRVLTINKMLTDNVIFLFSSVLR